MPFQVYFFFGPLGTLNPFGFFLWASAVGESFPLLVKRDPFEIVKFSSPRVSAEGRHLCFPVFWCLTSRGWTLVLCYSFFFISFLWVFLSRDFDEIICLSWRVNVWISLLPAQRVLFSLGRVLASFTILLLCVVWMLRCATLAFVCRVLIWRLAL